MSTKHFSWKLIGVALSIRDPLLCRIHPFANILLYTTITSTQIIEFYNIFGFSLFKQVEAVSPADVSPPPLTRFHGQMLSS